MQPSGVIQMLPIAHRKEVRVQPNAFPALVLNADFRPVSYFPLSILPWMDAVHAVFNDRVSVVAEYDVYARSPSTKIKIPSVVALREYQPAPKRVAFTRFNVFLRDRFHCQYCGSKFQSSDLTFDHVVPRARGGKTAWDNIVAACSPCNTKKDRLLLKPLRMPREPSPHDLLAAKKAFPPNYLHETWIDHLFWDSELER
jgi:5-methylcytosine-specific restriction endonuclease McrA